MHPSNIAGTDLLRVRLSEESRKLLQIDNLSDACSRGDSSKVISKIIEEIKANATPNQFQSQPTISRTDSFGRTALHYAAMKGRGSVVNVLLNNGFNPNQDDMHGSYPLHLAIQSNHYDAAIELCKVSKPNLVNYRRENAVLLLSKNRYNPKMIQLLSELINNKHDINLPDSRKCNALFYAVDNPLFIKQLMKNGANVNHKDDFNRNALFNAVYATNVEVAKLLINGGSEIEITDDFDHTPLMLAACFGDVQIVDILIEHGANVNATIRSKVRSNAWLMSPLSLALRHTNYDVAKLLVQCGADLDVHVAENETIWDIFMDQKYDFDGDAETDDAEMDDAEEGMIVLPDDMDLEIYSFGECAKLNPNAKRSYSRSSWDRVERRLKNKKRHSLLEYMEKVQTDRKMKSLIDTELVKKLKVPKDILNLIASPLVWH